MKSPTPIIPPPLATRLLRWFCAPHRVEELEGDLDELFQERVESVGLRKARWRYIRDVLSLMRPFVIKRKPNGPAYREYPNPAITTMLRNYFTIASRRLIQQKGYTVINVLGLGLGLAACILIFLVVRNELSYDSYHQKADRTYRVTVHGLDYNPSVSFAVAPAFRTDFPEAEQVSQYFYMSEGQVQVHNDRFMVDGYAFADARFAQVFDFTWLAGNPATALTEPNTVVLTERMARKYFGEQEALGKTIR